MSDVPIESAARLTEVVLDALALPVVVMDAEHVRYVNEPASKLFGMERDELIGTPVDDLVHADSADATRERRRLVIDHGNSFKSVQLKLMRSDRACLRLTANVRPIVDAGTTYVLATITDACVV